MKLLFPALEARFNSHKLLKATGRKLHHGQEGQKVTDSLPYVEVTCLDNDDELSTFHVDIERYQLRFTAHMERKQPGKANDIKELLTEVFRHANLDTADFETVSCVKQGSSGPVLNDGVYSVEVDFEVIIQRRVKQPVVRGV